MAKTPKKIVKKAAPTKATKKKAAPRKRLENNQVRTGTYGGKRKGSGRKKGAATQKTRAIADKLAESDEITPLEYMLQTMRETPEKIKLKFDKGEIDAQEYIVALADLQRRRDKAAESAAPFIHPRLSSVEASVGLKGHDAFVDLLLQEE